MTANERKRKVFDAKRWEKWQSNYDKQQELKHGPGNFEKNLGIFFSMNEDLGVKQYCLEGSYYHGKDFYINTSCGFFPFQKISRSFQPIGPRTYKFVAYHLGIPDDYFYRRIAKLSFPNDIKDADLQAGRSQITGVLY